MKLRLALPFRYFALRFNVSEQTISKYFHLYLSIMGSQLSSFVRWPTREELQITMPLAFREQFKDKVTTMIDCFEVQMEKSAFLKASAQSWSHYKHAHSTYYIIFGCNCITRLCQEQCRSSDKFITEHCGFLDRLHKGDVILADIGFLINAAVTERKASLALPAFTKGKNQLHPLEVEQTRLISNVRIHVERVIGLMRSKFRRISDCIDCSKWSR